MDTSWKRNATRISCCCRRFVGKQLHLFPGNATDIDECFVSHFIILFSIVKFITERTVLMTTISTKKFFFHLWFHFHEIAFHLTSLFLRVFTFLFNFVFSTIISIQSRRKNTQKEVCSAELCYGVHE